MLVATSCGGEASTVEAGDGNTSTAAPADSPGSDADSESADSDPDEQDQATEPVSDEPTMAESSPIGAFFSEDGGFEAAINEYRVKVEEEIIVCMAAQGFEFKSTPLNRDPISELQADMTVREWTEQYGYGISTSFDTFFQSSAGDPNAEIVFSLGEQERELWLETLTGQAGFGGIGGPGDTPLEEQGCIGSAIQATGGGDAIEGMEEFGAAYQEGEEALLDRAEMVDAVDAWTRCLSEGGYPGMSHRDAPSESINAQFIELMTPMQAALAEIDPEQGRALFTGDSVELADVPDLDVDALRTLQSDEIALAVADLDCYDAHVKDTYEPLRDDFERGLMVEYQTQLDALKNIGQ